MDSLPVLVALHTSATSDIPVLFNRWYAEGRLVVREGIELLFIL
jgi:hypothetical protein